MSRWFSILLTVAFTIFLNSPLQAEGGETFTVTRLDDPTPDACSPGDCSLREAVIAANADPLPDTISFALDGTVELAIAPAGANDAASGDLNVTEPVLIQGRGASATVVDGNQLDRVFSLEGNANPDPPCPAYALERLTVTGGLVTGNGGGVAAGWCSELTRVILRNNVASNYGGGGS